MKLPARFTSVRIHEGDDLTDTLFQLHADSQPTNINLQELGDGSYRVYFDFLDTKGHQQDIGFPVGFKTAMQVACKAHVLALMAQDTTTEVEA